MNESGAATTYVFRYVFSNNLVAWLGVAGLVLASLLNVLLRQRQPKTDKTTSFTS